MTPTTILVPLNGGPDGERAVPVARQFAGRLGVADEVSVVLLLALDGPDEPAARLDAQRYLDAVRASMPEVDVVAEIHAGNPADVIVGGVERSLPALLCMSTHGRVGPMAAVLGNVAEAVMHQCVVPAVLVGPSCFPVERSGVERMVVCYDGSDESDALVQATVEWSGRWAAAVDVVMVLHRDGTFLGDHDAAAPRRRAEAFTARLVAAGVDAGLELLDGLDPARAVAGHAARTGAVLVLAASHRRTPMTSRVLGHVNTRIAHHSPCPVLVLPPVPLDD